MIYYSEIYFLGFFGGHFSWTCWTLEFILVGASSDFPHRESDLELKIRDH